MQALGYQIAPPSWTTNRVWNTQLLHALESRRRFRAQARALDLNNSSNNYDVHGRRRGDRAAGNHANAVASSAALNASGGGSSGTLSLGGSSRSSWSSWRRRRHDGDNAFAHGAGGGLSNNDSFSVQGKCTSMTFAIPTLLFSITLGTLVPLTVYIAINTSFCDVFGSYGPSVTCTGLGIFQLIMLILTGSFAGYTLLCILSHKEPYYSVNSYYNDVVLYGNALSSVRAAVRKNPAIFNAGASPLWQGGNELQGSQRVVPLAPQSTCIVNLNEVQCGKTLSLWMNCFMCIIFILSLLAETIYFALLIRSDGCSCMSNYFVGYLYILTLLSQLYSIYTLGLCGVLAASLGTSILPFLDIQQYLLANYLTQVPDPVSYAPLVATGHHDDGLRTSWLLRQSLISTGRPLIRLGTLPHSGLTQITLEDPVQSFAHLGLAAASALHGPLGGSAGLNELLDANVSALLESSSESSSAESPDAATDRAQCRAVKGIARTCAATVGGARIWIYDQRYPRVPLIPVAMIIDTAANASQQVSPEAYASSSGSAPDTDQSSSSASSSSSPSSPASEIHDASSTSSSTAARGAVGAGEPPPRADGHRSSSRRQASTSGDVPGEGAGSRAPRSSHTPDPPQRPVARSPVHNGDAAGDGAPPFTREEETKMTDGSRRRSSRTGHNSGNAAGAAAATSSSSSSSSGPQTALPTAAPFKLQHRIATYKWLYVHINTLPQGTLAQHPPRPMTMLAFYRVKRYRPYVVAQSVSVAAVLAGALAADSAATGTPLLKACGSTATPQLPLDDHEVSRPSANSTPLSMCLSGAQVPLLSSTSRVDTPDLLASMASGINDAASAGLSSTTNISTQSGRSPLMSPPPALIPTSGRLGATTRESAGAAAGGVTSASTTMATTALARPAPVYPGYSGPTMGTPAPLPPVPASEKSCGHPEILGRETEEEEDMCIICYLPLWPDQYAAYEHRWVEVPNKSVKVARTPQAHGSAASGEKGEGGSSNKGKRRHKRSHASQGEETQTESGLDTAGTARRTKSEQKDSIGGVRASELGDLPLGDTPQRHREGKHTDDGPARTSNGDTQSSKGSRADMEMRDFEHSGETRRSSRECNKNQQDVRELGHETEKNADQGGGGRRGGHKSSSGGCRRTRAHSSAQDGSDVGDDADEEGEHDIASPLSDSPGALDNELGDAANVSQDQNQERSSRVELGLGGGGRGRRQLHGQSRAATVPTLRKPFQASSSGGKQGDRAALGSSSEAAAGGGAAAASTDECGGGDGVEMKASGTYPPSQALQSSRRHRHEQERKGGPDGHLDQAKSDTTTSTTTTRVPLARAGPTAAAASAAAPAECSAENLAAAKRRKDRQLRLQSLTKPLLNVPPVSFGEVVSVCAASTHARMHASCAEDYLWHSAAAQTHAKCPVCRLSVPLGVDLVRRVQQAMEALDVGRTLGQM